MTQRTSTPQICRCSVVLARQPAHSGLFSARQPKTKANFNKLTRTRRKEMISWNRRRPLTLNRISERFRKLSTTDLSRPSTAQKFKPPIANLSHLCTTTCLGRNLRSAKHRPLWRRSEMPGRRHMQAKLILLMD